jgi:hypothetical protein
MGLARALGPIALAVLMAGCILPRGPGDRVPQRVEISVLAADPAAYDGRFIEVEGAVAFRLEHQVVCAQPADIDGEGTGSCVWIAFPYAGDGMDGDALQALHNHLAVLTGRFVARASGRSGNYPGVIIPQRARIVGTHDRGDIPPPPPEPPAAIRRE